MKIKGNIKCLINLFFNDG